VLINYRAREIHAKIVYYGPGLGGKTTNLLRIHARLPDHARGRMVSVATENERTLFFDFLPVNLGQVRGFRVRFHLYTVPGQGFYAASRRVILRDVDGVVFVADSHRKRFAANLASMDDLCRNLAGQRVNPEQLPMVMQWNKRDLGAAVPVPVLDEQLNLFGAPSFEAVATEGRGVIETLKTCCRLVLRAMESAQQSRLAEQRPSLPVPASRAAHLGC
jgi:signal recognition particle receptor subunit beta